MFRTKLVNEFGMYTWPQPQYKVIETEEHIYLIRDPVDPDIEQMFQSPLDKTYEILTFARFGADVVINKQSGVVQKARYFSAYKGA